MCILPGKKPLRPFREGFPLGGKKEKGGKPTCGGGEEAPHHPKKEGSTSVLEGEEESALRHGREKRSRESLRKVSLRIGGKKKSLRQDPRGATRNPASNRKRSPRGGKEKEGTGGGKEKTFSKVF